MRHGDFLFYAARFLREFIRETITKGEKELILLHTHPTLKHVLCAQSFRISLHFFARFTTNFFAGTFIVSTFE